MNYKIIDSLWFGKNSNIGIVIIEDKITKLRKAYIGISTNSDLEYIIATGTRLHKSALQDLADTL